MNFIKQHSLIIFFLMIYFVLALFTYKDFGITADEQLEYKSGKYYVAYFLQKQVNNETILSERHLPQNATYLRLYPGLLTLLNYANYYEWYHLLNLIFGAALFMVAYALLYLQYKNQKAAIFGPIFLLLTPRIIGDIPTNTKDIPFAILYLLGILLIYANSIRQRNNTVILILMGIVFGIAQSTRIIGLSLHVIFLIFGLLIVHDTGSKEKILRTFLHSSLVFILSLLTMFLLLPVLHQNTLQGFMSLVFGSARFDQWNNVKLYGGAFLDKTQNPTFYSIVWIFLTIPLYQLVLLGASFFKLNVLKTKNLWKLLVIAVVVNLLLIFLVDPVLYNGPRHFLFILTLLVILASIVYIESKNKVFRIIIIVGMILAGISAVSLHPYEYVYFGEHVARLNGVKGKYEMDYWGATYSEASKKLARTLPVSKNPANVYACNVDYAVAYHSVGKFNVTTDINEADYIICDYENDMLSKNSGKVIFTISRQGVPLNFVRINE